MSKKTAMQISILLAIPFIVALIGYLMFREKEEIVNQIQEKVHNTGQTQQQEKDFFAQLLRDGIYREEGKNYEIEIEQRGAIDERARMKLRTQLETMIRDFKEAVKERGEDETQDASLKIEIESYEGKGTKTYLMHVYTYLGGAHGQHEYESTHYLSATGEQIDIGDILKGTKDLEKLSQEAEEHFSQLLGENFERAGIAPTPGNWDLWYIDGDRIVFIFPPYAVAPYNLGVQVFSPEETGIFRFPEE